MWHRVAGFIIKFRIALLSVLLVITVLMGWQARKVEISYEFTRAIPVDNPKYKDYQDFRSQFGEDGNMMVIAVQTDKFFEPDFFSDYTALVHKIEGVRVDTTKAVTNVLSVPGAVILTKDTVTGQLTTTQLLPPGTVYDKDSVRNKFYDLPFYKGFLYNRSSQAYLMAVRIDKEILNSKKRSDVVDQITSVADSFGKMHQVEMHYSGLPLIRTQMAQQVQSEMRLFLMLSFALTALILFLFFRSVVGVLASMLVVAVGVVWSLGTIVLLGYKITILTALIPPLIVVIGIPNCVYFLNKYHSEYHLTGDKTKSLMRMVERMGIVTLFTNITAAIGFGVFFFTKSALLKEFGLVAGLNIMGIFFISLIFIPALFSFLPPPHSRHTSYLEKKWMKRLLDILTNWVFGHRKWIFAATGVICIVSLIGIMRLQNVTHIVDDLPKSDKVYQDLMFFENNFGGVMPLEIIIDTKKKNGATFPNTFVKMDSLTYYLKQIPGIGHTLSVTEGIKFAYQGMISGDSNSYILPEDLVLKSVGTELRRKNTNRKDNTFTKLLSSFMDSNFQKTRISVNMKDVGSKQLPVILGQILPKTYEIFDSSKYTITFTGTSVVFLEGNKFIINSLRDSLILAFIMIFSCMIFLFRSWKILLISLIVNVVPLMITAGIMGWTGIAIKPSTVLVFSVALGITIDVTIRFLVSFKQEHDRYKEDIPSTVRRTIHDTGLSIIYTSLILIAGFGVFSISHFDGTKALGYLTSLTLLVAMITNLTLQPALLMLIKKIKRGDTPDWMNENDVEEPKA